MSGTYKLVSLNEILILGFIVSYLIVIVSLINIESK